MVPARLVEALVARLAETRGLHESDLRDGAGWVELPDALGRKYPNAGREIGWQWLFPATRGYFDRNTGQLGEPAVAGCARDRQFANRAERGGARDQCRSEYRAC